MDIPNDIRLEDGQGNKVEAMRIHIAEVLRLIDKNISKDKLEKTFCLQFIDPWGDTIFNRIQIGVLINEFKYLLDNCQIEEEKQKIQSIIEFIYKAQEIYLFVRFYGD